MSAHEPACRQRNARLVDERTAIRREEIRGKRLGVDNTQQLPSCTVVTHDGSAVLGAHVRVALVVRPRMRCHVVHQHSLLGEPHLAVVGSPGAWCLVVVKNKITFD